MISPEQTRVNLLPGNSEKEGGLFSSIQKLSSLSVSLYTALRRLILTTTKAMFEETCYLLRNAFALHELWLSSRMLGSNDRPELHHLLTWTICFSVSRCTQRACGLSHRCWQGVCHNRRRLTAGQISVYAHKINSKALRKIGPSHVPFSPCLLEF